jgi:hypothetical protein
VQARVLLLRRGGVLLPNARETGKWFDGIFEMEHRPKRLVLRDIKSAPGLGIFISLYAPTIMSVHSHPGEFTFRGLEQITGADGAPAAVCQEWAAVFSKSFYFDLVKLRTDSSGKGD